jgi:hypothetical protein
LIRNNFENKVRKFVDVQRSIVFWRIFIFQSIRKFPNEKKTPWAGAGNVKVRAINWHDAHSQLQICPSPLINLAYMTTQFVE